MLNHSHKKIYSATALALFFLWVQLWTFSRPSDSVRFQVEKEKTEYSVQTEDAATPLDYSRCDGSDNEKDGKAFTTAITDLKNCCLYLIKFRSSLTLIDNFSFVRVLLYKWHHSWKIDLVE